MAKKKAASSKESASPEQESNWIWETLRTIVYALLIAGVFRSVFFQPFWIPSGSMKPTLLVGDFLFVNKMAYGYSWASCPNISTFNLCWFAKGFDGRILGSEPEPGDIIVFKHPVDDRDFIKRLIGVPGDRVKMSNGRLIVNDVELELEPDGIFEELRMPQGPIGNLPRCKSVVAGSGGSICEKDQYRETLPNGLSHAVLDIGQSFADNTPLDHVPPGHYLFIGDNRDNSQDGRFPQNMGGVGFVPFENLVGRADRVMFSSAGSWILAFWTWRSDRYFKSLE